MYTLQQLAGVLDITLIGNPTREVQHLLTDSRQLSEESSSLFVALKGERQDGHRYIASLYEKGLRAFLVSEPADYLKHYPEASFLLAEDTLQALQLLAAWHRSQFAIPVIGITGSNGKTIVKEWLYQLLKDDYHICRSPKSYNSQIGVPLSVWQLNATHTLGIFEAGISLPGEMQKLEAIIRPDIAVLTNLGTAHDEGFSFPAQKLAEKLHLADHSATLILQELNTSLTTTETREGQRVIRISKDKEGLTITAIEEKNGTTEITARFEGRTLQIRIPFNDKASIENAITCWAVMLAMSYDNALIAQRLQQLSPVAMRLEMKQGINNSILINDTYNSDINSLTIALHYQNQKHRGGKKIVLLSDIEQSGRSDEALYTDVANLLRINRTDLLIGIGPHLESHRSLFPENAAFFASTADFILAFQQGQLPVFQNATLLLKGARRFGFEAISRLLQQKSHDTILEINLDHLLNNVNHFRSLLSPGTKLMCMVKATGYGSGSAEIAGVLQHHHVDYLAVAYADEGVDLRKAGIHLPIMVMSPEESALEDLLYYQLEPEVFSFRVLDQIMSLMDHHGVTEFPIHLKLDTGMHRLGFNGEDLPALKAILQKHKALRVRSIFSHMVGSEDPQHDEFSRHQLSLFRSWTDDLLSVIDYPVLRHIANSSGISRFPEAHFDMVRLGIGMFGLASNPQEQTRLQHVSSLKTSISQIKTLESGDTVGYNRRGVVSRASRIATIPIGYADGFSRQLGNGNFYVLINGQQAKTIGSICMDMTMVDVTDIHCEEGDEVIVFSSIPELKAMAAAMSTIPYEILTSVSSRVKRIYVQE